MPSCFFSSFGTYITFTSFFFLLFLCQISSDPNFLYMLQVLPLSSSISDIYIIWVFLQLHNGSAFLFFSLLYTFLFSLLISYFEFMVSLNFNHYHMGKFQNIFFLSNQFWFGLLILENCCYKSIYNFFFYVQSQTKSCMCCSCTLFALFQEKIWKEGIISCNTITLMDGNSLALLLFCLLHVIFWRSYS